MKSSSKLRALRYFSILAFQLFSIFPLAAILDLNNNGMSDVWEEQYNNGELYPATFLPSNDPDEDGWSNATEAVAGTDPFEPNPPDGIVVTQLEPTQTQGGYTLTWPTIVGKRYRLQASYELDAWFSVGNSIFATGSSHSMGISAAQPDSTVPPKIFWRVIVADVDDDNDLLTNAEEYQLGTNPTIKDTDGDLIDDLAEILAATNPRDNDTDEDGIPDNLDTTPLVNNAIADPDGANLPAALNTYNFGKKLIARYDFENTFSSNNVIDYGKHPSSMNLSGLTVPTSGSLNVIANNTSWDIIQNPAGLPSRTVRWSAVTSAPSSNTTPIPNLQHLAIPRSVFNGNSTFSVCYWLKCPKDLLVGAKQYSLLGIGHDTTGSGGRPTLHWYIDTVDGTIKVETYRLNAQIQQTIVNIATAPEVLNDGNWHHICLSKSGSTYNTYIDGVKATTTFSSQTSITLNNLTSSAYCLIGRADLTTHSDELDQRFPVGTHFDRLRIYSSSLNATDALALYNQDIDNDGLYDRTEARHRLWQDKNNNNTREANESIYICQPFHHDVIGTDHDKDGISSHDEQNIPDPSSGYHSDPANFDTDNDLLPDGWEKANGFSYATTDAISNKAQDPDGDGLTNYKEYLKGTQPGNNDTDGDGTNDGQDGNPKDPSDQGQAPDPALTYSLKLGVGDESGSDSEHYEMVIYTYDWETNSETEYTRFAPDSYGDYLEGNMAGFDPLQTYTFQIRWKGTKLDTYNGKGPDLDYTFKVEPVNSQDLVSVSEVFLPESATFEVGSILGQKQNVNDFAYSTEPKRVVTESLPTDLAVDTDMDGKIESIYRKLGNSNQNGPDQSKEDRELLANDPQRAVIIDINNNNTDSGNQKSSGKAEVDNSNDKIDSQADKAEITDADAGHNFGKIRLWCWPNPDFGIPWKGNKDPKYKIKLSYADPAQANYVRVFGPDDVATDNTKPKVYLGPGKTEHLIEAKEFFTETPFKTPKLDTAYRNLVAEGITYGTATIKMEVINIATGMPVGEAHEVRVTVNVDRLQQVPDLVAKTKDAEHLRGKNPHHFGVRKQNQSTAGIRALRGKLTIKIPSTTSANNTQLTPMRSNKLKKQLSGGIQTDSGASFWIGLTQNNPNGSLAQWVQTGVRWLQPTDQEIASPPALYLETGDTYVKGASGKTQETIEAFNYNWLKEGVTKNADAILSNWNTQTLQLDFILFKPIVASTNGFDDSISHWHALFKDANGNYLLMKRSDSSANGSIGAQNQQELIDRYKSQSFRDIDCLFEANNSITFAVGSADAQSSFSDLQYAVSYVPQNASMPSSSNKAILYDWAFSNFSWSNTEFGNSTAEIKTGRLSGTKAENGAHDHPYWRKTNTATSLNIWDVRNFAFGAAP